jgi:6-phosphogluconolactonase (cycloisomerase 2 family)
MHGLSLCLSIGLLPITVLGASSLLVSHYSGNIYTLTLSDSGALSIAKTVRAGNSMPAWLTLDSNSKTLYCPDESTYGRPVIASFSVGADGTLTPKAQASTRGGELHSTLYGGQDGAEYLATAA